MAKYILSDDRVKEVYSILKNRLMSIKGMKSRTSWFYDAFNCGRVNFAKLSVRGKYLALYINLEPNDYPENIYHQEDVRDRRRYKETRFKIHVKSDRTIKYAFRLIDDCVKLFGLKYGKKKQENYYLPKETQEALVERGLIQLETGKVKEDEYLTYQSDVKIEIDSYVKNDDDIQNEKQYKNVIFVDGSKVFVKERKSFEAKLILSSPEAKDYYSKIKNRLLTFTHVRSRISWKYDAFSLGRIKLAKIQIRGKYVCLFLALEIEKHNLRKEGLENHSKYDLFKDTPLLIRIKNEEKLNQAMDLIDELRKRFLLNEGFLKENHDFSKEFESDKNLSDLGLIKTYKKLSDEDSKQELQNRIETQNKIKTHFPVYKEEERLVLTIDKNNNFVPAYETIKIPLEGERELVYLDEIEKAYKDGDIVTKESLKEKGIIDNETIYYKVSYRGGNYNRKVKIIATSFSPIALKVMEDSGSTYELEEV